MKNSTYQRMLSTVFTVLMVMTLHNLDFTDANSIPMQESQNVALDSTTFNSNQVFKNCSTNSDCPAELGETCVSGTCLCNRFGWINEPCRSSNSCNRITCTLHGDCRSHFGRGAYCNETAHFCSCATEIDPITQKCADTFLQINAKRAEDSTCEWNFGTESYCKCKSVCVCYAYYRFSPSQRKCVPMEENVYLTDWEAIDYFLAVFAPIYLVCVFVILYVVERDDRKIAQQQLNRQQNLIVPNQDIAKAPPHKYSNTRKSQSEFAVSLPSISESLFCEDPKAKQSENEPPPDYSEAVFGSTKFKLVSSNLEQQQQKDEDSCKHQNPQQQSNRIIT